MSNLIALTYLTTWVVVPCMAASLAVSAWERRPVPADTHRR